MTTSLIEFQKKPLVEDQMPYVGVLYICRPDKANALTWDIGEALSTKISELENDRDLRALILTGKGPVFSAGGDLRFLNERVQDSPQNNENLMRRFYQLFLGVRRLKVPLIGAINGHAIGAGLAWALAMDIRVCSANAKLGLTFVKLGLHPGMGSTHFLPRIAGPEIAARLLMGGETISGEKALQWGLVSQVVEPDQVMSCAMEIAQGVARASGHAVRLTTQTLRAQLDEGLEEALQREAESQAQSYRHSDIQEGISAIAEKRTPRFS